jgi:hypothetical protein
MRRTRIRETQIQGAVIDHWRKAGLPGTMVFAIPNANAFGQPGLTPGVFDLGCIGPHIPGRVGFIELKTDKGIVSDAQKDFKALLLLHDIAYAITYGRDEPITVLEAWKLVRPRIKGVLP